MPWTSPGIITFSSALNSGSRWWNWNTKPIVRLRSSARRDPGRRVTSSPARRIDPLGGDVERADAVQERRLARAGRADDADHLAVVDLHVDAPEHLERAPHVAERLLDVVRDDERLAHGTPHVARRGFRCWRARRLRLPRPAGQGSRASVVDRFSGWARARGPIAVTFAGLAVLGGLTGSAAPGRDLGALAAALGQAAGGRPREPGGRALAAVRGRARRCRSRSLGPLSRSRAGGRHARRLAGAGAGLAGRRGPRRPRRAYDLTSTPLGDDHELVVRGDHAAFATRAYGQEQSVTVLSLAGEGAQNKTADASATG